LSKKVDYALVALAYLARHENETSSVREMVCRLGVPPRLLANILSQLTHYGIVASTRGLHGGYQLARPPENISLVDLIEAVEGPIRLTQCCSNHQGERESGDNHDEECSRQRSCEISSPLRKLRDGLRVYLGRVTLRDIVSNTVAPGAKRLNGIQSPLGERAEGVPVAPPDSSPPSLRESPPSME
jgi:Rrf2 family protein